VLEPLLPVGSADVLAFDRAPLPAVRPELAEDLAGALAFAAAEKAEATRKAYASDFRHFRQWCRSRKVGELPAEPDTVAAYLNALATTAGLKVSTINRRVAAIRYAHRLQDLEPPITEAVKAVHRGIRRTLGTAPRKKAPATAEPIAEMLSHVPKDTLKGKRDRALLLNGFAIAQRRSNIVALDVEDLERKPQGVLVHIRRSKTDQEGRGRIVPVPIGSKLKPVAALDAWLEAAGITTGPIFRRIRRGDRLTAERLSAAAVALIVKTYAGLAGYDVDDFAGHSLRSGFVTQALEDGADLLKVMAITGHEEVRTLKEYDRRASAFRNHAGRGFL
jgi:site-specific recombinase XerD